MERQMRESLRDTFWIKKLPIFAVLLLSGATLSVMMYNNIQIMVSNYNCTTPPFINYTG